MRRSRACGDAVPLNSAHRAASSSIGGLAGSGRTATDRPAALSAGLSDGTTLTAGPALPDPDDFMEGAGLEGLFPFSGSGAFPFSLPFGFVMPSRGYRGA